MSDHDLSRRDLIKSLGTGAAAAGLVSAGLGQAPAAPPAANAADAEAAEVALSYPTPQGDPMGGPGFFGRPSTPRDMKTLLIWADTRNGIAQHDMVSHAATVISQMGYDTGTYFSFIRTDSNIIAYHPKMTTGQPASGGPSLANVDAIFFLGHRDVPIDDRQKADLLHFVHDQGKGFVAAHMASTAWLDWPAFGDLLGGRYDNHPWEQTTAAVVVEDPSFPGMQFFPRVFQFHDEFYQASHFSAAQSRVLMRLDPASVDMARRGVVRADAPFPLTWAKMYGQGRVFYSCLGHDSGTWDIPAIRRMWFNAVEWALRLRDADVAPRPVSATVPPPPARPAFGRRGFGRRGPGRRGGPPEPGR